MTRDAPHAALMQLSKCRTRTEILHLQHLRRRQEPTTMRLDPRECLGLVSGIQYMLHEIIDEW